MSNPVLWIRETNFVNLPWLTVLNLPNLTSYVREQVFIKGKVYWLRRVKLNFANVNVGVKVLPKFATGTDFTPITKRIDLIVCVIVYLILFEIVDCMLIYKTTYLLAVLPFPDNEIIVQVSNFVNDKITLLISCMLGYVRCHGLRDKTIGIE